jgi:acetyl esterase/lipase
VSRIGADRLIDKTLAEVSAKIGLPDFVLTDENLSEYRTLLATPIPYEISGNLTITEVSVPGATGDPDVKLRVCRPKHLTAPLPCIYYIHGGGMVMGTADRSDVTFEKWCNLFNCVGVSVEYRLAPEMPYPGPLEDCYAGLLHVFNNPKDFGVDPARIGIAGPSAGGGLAAGLGLLARDRGKISVLFQLLIYPMIDDRFITPSSQWEDTPVWTSISNRYGWKSYLGDTTGADSTSSDNTSSDTKVVPIYAAPARATDLSGLPSSYVMVGTLDGFLDEDIAYANKLMQAGVPTELHVYPGATHGFDSLARAVPIARQAVDDMERWLAKHLNPPQ